MKEIMQRPELDAAHQLPTVLVSVDQVRLALAEIGRRYPELEQAMTVADKMLVRLDTIRDECALQASQLRGEGDAAERVRANIETMCGHWGEPHSLYMPERRTS